MSQSLFIHLPAEGYLVCLCKLAVTIKAMQIFVSTCFGRNQGLWLLMCVCLVAHPVWLCRPMDCSLPGASVQGDSPGKNSGVGCHALLQESSQPRDRTQVSHIVGIFFTIWATRGKPMITQPFDNVAYNFVRSCQIFFNSGNTVLCSHWQWMRISFAFSVVSILDFGHSNKCALVCCFNLHFPNYM